VCNLCQKSDSVSFLQITNVGLLIPKQKYLTRQLVRLYYDGTFCTILTNDYCLMMLKDLYAHIVFHVCAVCNEPLLSSLGASANASDGTQYNPEEIQTGGVDDYCSSTNTVGEYLEVSWIFSVLFNI
jgi:hypothetical protein